jgi:integral membrane sensor domain MASE1
VRNHFFVVSASCLAIVLWVASRHPETSGLLSLLGTACVLAMMASVLAARLDAEMRASKNAT